MPDTITNELTTAEGTSCPPLALGTSALGSIDPTGLFGRKEKRRSFRILDEVYEAGCRVFDLARSYQIGGTEKVVGEWLAQSGVREEIFLLSKIGHPLPVIAPNRLGRVPLEEDLQKTLRALKIDSLDALMLHRDHPDASLEELRAFFVSVKRRTLSRFVGVSNWHASRIAALEDDENDFQIDASSPQFSLAAWSSAPWDGCVSISGQANRHERKFYKERKLPTFAYCALGQGFLTSQNESKAKIFRQPKNVAIRERATKLAKEKNVSLAAIALSYLRHQAFPVFPVTGVSSGRNMKKNLEALSLELTKREVSWLESEDSPY